MVLSTEKIDLVAAGRELRHETFISSAENRLGWIGSIMACLTCMHTMSCSWSQIDWKRR